ncbi:hypothetical protein Dimus_023826 [Dionaea muscipula]
MPAPAEGGDSSLLDDVVPPRRRWRRSKTGESGGVGAEKGSWAPLRWRLMEKMGELDVGGDPDLGEDVGELGALGGGATWDRRRRWGRSAAAVVDGDGRRSVFLVDPWFQRDELGDEVRLGI